MNEKSGKVKCRKLRGEWWLMLIICPPMAAFFTFGAITPDNENDSAARFMCALNAFLILLGLIYFHLQTFRPYIIADDGGLRWRNIRREHFARWDEVVDFYVDRSSTRKIIIATKNGELNAHNFGNQEAFRAFVRSHATKSASREWTTRHVSEKAKWPRTFSYKNSENIIMPLLPFALALLMSPFFLFTDQKSTNSTSVFEMFREMWVYGGPIVGTAFIAMMLVVVAVLVVAFSLPLVTYFLDGRARWKQRVIATPNDITFYDGENIVLSSWGDVRKVTKSGDRFFIRRYFVETRCGNFSFTNNIYAYSALLQLFREYAKDAVESVTSQEAAERADGLGVALVRNGQKIHHFRARHNRIILWSVWSLAFMPILPMLIYHPEDRAQVQYFAIFFLSFLGVVIASWLTYFSKTNYVATDENGLIQRTSLRTRFIAWSDVERFGKNDWSFFVVESAKERIYIWSEIAEQQQLLDEIAQRSINSHTREWHEL